MESLEILIKSVPVLIIQAWIREHYLENTIMNYGIAAFHSEQLQVVIRPKM